MNLAFLITFLNFLKILQIKCQNTQSVFIPNFCLAASNCSGVPCSQNGNCFIDIFKYYNNSNKDVATECRCHVGWNSNVDSEVKCCYPQKLQTFVFLMECTLGFGTGHFYMGKYTIAIIKFCISFILTCFICVFGFLHCYREGEYGIEVSSHSRKTNRFSFYIFLVSLCFYIIGHVTDLVLIGLNFYLDGNGQELAEW
jgi:hypothetical protein